MEQGILIDKIRIHSWCDVRLGSEHDANRFLHKYMVQTSDQRVSSVIKLFQNTAKLLVEIEP